MARDGLAWGAVIMGCCNASKIVLQLALMPTLARLLGPANFGIYSLALPSVTFVMMLADAGLGQSLAREPEAHTKVWSSAFWMLLVLGATLAAALSLWSFPLARIAHQPLLPQVMTALSVCILLFTLTVSPSARLTRRGRIQIFSLIDLGASILGGACAVGLALNGAGVWSFVGQFLTVYGVRAVLANLAAFRRPHFTFDWRAVAPHTLLGGSLVATKLIDSLGRMLESIVVSRRFGAGTLGMYAFSGQAAWSLVQAVNSPTGTMLYARALNSAPAQAKDLYLRLVRVTAMITLPATAIVAGAAPLIASVLLGKAWLQATLLLAMMFPAQAIGTLGQLSGAVLYAEGRSFGQLCVALFNSSLRVVAVLIPFGGWPALAIYVAAANLGYLLAGLLNARIQLGWSFASTLTAIRGPLLASVCAGLTAWILAQQGGGGGLAHLIAVLVLAAASYGLALCVLDFGSVCEDWRLLMVMVGREQPRAAAA